METKNTKINKYRPNINGEEVSKCRRIRLNKCKKRDIIDDRQFTIPTYNESENFLSKNYRVSFLKEICKFYKIKISGNKSTLIARIHNHLVLSKSAIIIQKNIRMMFLLQYNNLRGPALFKRDLCKNDKDFFTLNDIKTISYTEFISYKDSVGNLWGFNIKSLYNLFLKNDFETKSPYTREKIEFQVFKNIKKIFRRSKILNYKIDFSLNENTELLTHKKKIELRCLDLFQYIDQLGNYTDSKWLLSLNKINLIKFIRELADIWGYRASLTDAIKKDICYPSGDPFRSFNLNTLHMLPFISLQKTSLTLIEQLIKTGINLDNSKLGASYVLCALTLVNIDAADALPWLYQSVANLE